MTNSFDREQARIALSGDASSSRLRMMADLIVPPGEHWRRDPVAWATERAKIELWSKQREILASVASNPRTAVQSCHEIGKSFSAATVIEWFVDVHPPDETLVVTSAPSDKQVKAILWREINKAHSRLNLAGRTNLSEWYIGNRLVAFGRKPADHDPTAFQGLHDRFLLVVLDEACGIPKELWDAASTLGANKYARFLAIGNPDDPNSEFAAVCKSPDWHNITVGFLDTPNFTNEPVSESLKEMLISVDWVNERRRKWGEGSALFISKCEGKFPTEASPFAVIPLGWIERARWSELPASYPKEAGIDVGGGGDRTVIFERCGPRAGRYEVFIDSDPMKTVGMLALKLEEWGIEKAKVDSTGIGWGIAGRLRELSRKHNSRGEGVHSAEVVSENFGEGPTAGKEELFLNRRAELYWNLREKIRLESVNLEVLEDDMVAELTTPQYEILDSKGKIKIQPKKEIIELLGRSPDFADALVLAFFDTVTVGSISDAGIGMPEEDLSRVNGNTWTPDTGWNRGFDDSDLFTPW